MNDLRLYGLFAFALFAFFCGYSFLYIGQAAAEVCRGRQNSSISPRHPAGFAAAFIGRVGGTIPSHKSEQGAAARLDTTQQQINRLESPAYEGLAHPPSVMLPLLSLLPLPRHQNEPIWSLLHLALPLPPTLCNLPLFMSPLHAILATYPASTHTERGQDWFDSH